MASRFPNYHYEDLRELSNMYAESGLKNPGCDHRHQPLQFRQAAGWSRPRIAKDILLQHAPFVPTSCNLVKGLMIESYIEDGSQKVGGRRVR